MAAEVGGSATGPFSAPATPLAHARREEDDALAQVASTGAVTTPSEIKTGPVIGVLVIVGDLLAIFVF